MPACRRSCSSQRFHYAWVVAGVTFVVLMMAAGFRSVPGVLFVPLGQEFGWSHALIGGAVSVNLDRLRPRRAVRGRASSSASACAGCRRSRSARSRSAPGSRRSMTQPWQLYLLWGVVIGSATGALAVPLAAIISTRWFSTRRGLVSGLLTASNASGQLVFLPLLAWISITYGWRWTAGAVVIAAIGLVIPLAIIFLRHSPAEIGISPYGATEPRPAGAAARQSVPQRRRDAPRVRAAARLPAARVRVLRVRRDHERPHRHAPDRGLRRPRLHAGAGRRPARGDRRVRHHRHDHVGLADRSLRPALAAVLVLRLRGISLLGLNAALSSAGIGLAAFVIFDGLDWVATVPPTIALCRKIAGPERVGVVFAWVFCSHQLGAAFAAWGAGFTRSWLGTYEPAFLISGALGDRRGDGQPDDRPAHRAPALRLIAWNARRAVVALRG